MMRGSRLLPVAVALILAGCSGSKDSGIVGTKAPGIPDPGTGPNLGAPPDSGIANPHLPPTIVVNPTDSDQTKIQKIENAQAGDVVAIATNAIGAPYHFQLWLTNAGTSSQPIVIEAQDPNHPPTFDYSARSAENWPNDSGDPTRGCWQISGGTYYLIDGVRIIGCSSASSNFAAGIRLLHSDHVTIRHTYIHNSDLGIFIGADNTVVQFTELDANGISGDSNVHNLYDTGGDNLTVSYSFLHDAVGGQNLHIRARHATIAYNWIARADDYEYDMMSPDTNYDTTPPPDNTTHLLMLGNLIDGPGNGTKLATLYDDQWDQSNQSQPPSVSMALTLLWNTFVVNSSSALVQIRNDTLASASVLASNNIFGGTTQSFLTVADSSSHNYTISGARNWFNTGSSVSSLTNSIFGNSPGFTNPSNLDFTLLQSSQCRGVADTTASPHPVFEYYQNETNKLMYRVRGGVSDIGAFDSTTTSTGIAN